MQGGVCRKKRTHQLYILPMLHTHACGHALAIVKIDRLCGTNVLGVEQPSSSALFINIFHHSKEARDVSVFNTENKHI